MSAERSPAKIAIERVNDLIDEYHAMPQPAELQQLYFIRRDLVAANSVVTRFVKQTYGHARLSYAQRKWTVAATIAKALEEDMVKIKSERRAFSHLEASGEALATTLLMRTKEIDAEGDWEEMVATMKAVDKALMAIGQEITDGRKEKDYDNYLEGLRAKDIAEQQH